MSNTQIPPAPLRSPFFDAPGRMNADWQRWFLQITPMSNAVTTSLNSPTPASRTVVNETTVTDTDYTVFADASKGSFTVYLPAAPALNQTREVKKIDTTSNTVVLDGNGNLIDGYSQVLLTFRGIAIEVKWDGEQWRII
jgi:hypothetical protein